MNTSFIQDEVMNIHKPAGMSSFDVIRQLRKRYGRIKMGHAGTLDPFASGVLLIATGKQTKNISDLQKLEKEYIAEVRFGYVSTTYDPEGEIIEIVPDFDAQGFEKQKHFFPNFSPDVKNFVEPECADMQNVVKKYIGTIDQMPPVFSAKKVDGKRAYALARKGTAVKLSPKEVVIYDIKILEYVWPVLKIRVKCGSGTYIRSLGYDIGRELGCGAYLTALERTRIGNYRIEDALPLPTLPL